MPVPGLLNGIRVLDLTRFLAGPYGAMMLADMGAEVIKIEEPGGDPIRQVGPPFVNGESAYYLSISKNKRSIGVDLRQPEGRQVLYRLVERADALIENYRPGVTKRLGIDYDTLAAINPRLVYCSISGFGQTGPYRDRPGFDILFQAMGGGLSLTGTADGKLVRMGLGIGDMAGGMFGAFGIASALFARERTGRGAYIDVSCLDGQIALLAYFAGYYFADGRILGPQGTGHDTIVPYGLYYAADRPIVIACLTDAFFKRLCAVLGRPDIADDPRYATIADRREHRKVLEPLIAELIAQRPADEILRGLYEGGVPAAPVYNVAEALNDEHVLARHMVVDVQHPTVGAWKVTGNPVKVAGVPDDVAEPPPLLGQHTDEILGGVLGCGADEIAALRASGAVF
jgi:formyl-CoA transferase/CoA:oxalate CoA-transferase